MFFYIKPGRYNSTTSVPFILRTLWEISRWTQITFNFIAEDRSDIEAGYYQVDSGDLAGCHNGESVDILLPFKNAFAVGANLKQLTFLHGYEISTVAKVPSGRTPF